MHMVKYTVIQVIHTKTIEPDEYYSHYQSPLSRVHFPLPPIHHHCLAHEKGILWSMPASGEPRYELPASGNCSGYSRQGLSLVLCQPHNKHTHKITVNLLISFFKSYQYSLLCRPAAGLNGEIITMLR